MILLTVSTVSSRRFCLIGHFPLALETVKTVKWNCDLRLITRLKPCVNERRKHLQLHLKQLLSLAQIFRHSQPCAIVNALELNFVHQAAN